MARNPETKQYITWADVMQAWQWFERGYNVRIVLDTSCACPPGETEYHLYLQMFVFDPDVQPVPLESRPKFRYPSAAYSTYPGCVLALLYRLDESLAKVRLWTEPTFTAEPKRGRPPRK